MRAAGHQSSERLKKPLLAEATFNTKGVGSQKQRGCGQSCGCSDHTDKASTLYKAYASQLATVDKKIESARRKENMLECKEQRD